ncbi:MAG: putative aliphatic sulfonates-binding protein precursor [Syntrophorhabdaceae bacterium PtaU1.Bin034]|nr:MAG: putative aliphatic sulfonates-binding protein precursor [Syntrophorhabdaceae bacterium PtaU1.Bin034]
MKRSIMTVIAVIVLIFVVVGVASAAESKKPEKIRFAYQTAHTLFVVANELGWFQEEFSKDGIAFEAKVFVAGPPIIEAFAGGRLDFGLVGDQPALLARANGIDIKAVGVPLSGYKNLALVVPAGSKITGVSDLKGKRVGVTVGSVGQHLLYLFLKKNGLKPSDIKQFNLQPPDIKLALSLNHIDAAVTWDPWISIIEEEKIGRPILDGSGLKNNANVIIVAEQFAKDYPDVIKRVLKIFLRAEEFVENNPEKAIAISAKATGYKREVQARAFRKFDYDIRLTDDVVKSIEQTALFLRESNLLRKDVNVKDLVDTRYLKSIGAQ